MHHRCAALNGQRQSHKEAEYRAVDGRRQHNVKGVAEGTVQAPAAHTGLSSKSHHGRSWAACSWGDATHRLCLVLFLISSVAWWYSAQYSDTSTKPITMRGQLLFNALLTWFCRGMVPHALSHVACPLQTRGCIHP